MYKTMLLVKELLGSNYHFKQCGEFIKYYNIHFDILIQNKKIMFIRDKRFDKDIIYKDYRTAIYNISNQYS